MKDRKKYVSGCIVGGALGDAMGADAEHMTLIQIKKKYGEVGVIEPPTPALYTDDTQMTLRVALGLVATPPSGGSIDFEGAAESVAKQLVAWMDEDPPRSPGQACLFGAANLKKGVSWREAGNKERGKGCGAAMRSAPYGLIAAGDPKTAGEWAAQHAKMTHNDTTGMAGAAAVAAAVAAAWGAEDAETVVQAMIDAAFEVDEPTGNMICIAAGMVDKLTPEQALYRWPGWRGDEAAAASAYCILKSIRTEEPFENCVRMAVNSPGDSDSLGAIVGNIAGAWLGVESIPNDWPPRLENLEFILQVCEHLESMVE